MCATNSIKLNWWEKVNVIILAATSKLCIENEEIQEELKKSMELDVNIIKCKAFAGELGYPYF
jgi:hypothetical protein